MAQPAFDHGAVDDATPADHMLLLLNRSAQQSASLAAFLGALQDKTSPEYHQFLSPAQFSAQFEPAAADIQSVSAWLQAQGFRIDKVSAGHQAIEFSGTAGQVRQAFHTAIHSYIVSGEQHYANATPPDVPTTLAPLVQGLLIGNFGPHTQLHHKGTALLDKTSHRAQPLFNVPEASPFCLQSYCYGVTPGDFATIYDTRPLLSAGIDGTGITVGTIGDAPIDLPSAQYFRQNFLPTYSATNLPVPILDGPAPTIYGGGDEIEAQLDVEELGGVAPNATVNYYYGATGYTSDGVNLGLIRAIDDNQISILSISWGGCESYFGNTGDAFYNNLYQQAAAQGITVVVAAGDSGSANCDPPPNSAGFTQASNGLAVSGMASTPYNIAVGGTDFYYPANATPATLANYWTAPSSTAANNNPDWSSAKSYIPEKPWNISNETLNQITSYQALGAGGGGKSSCINSTGATPNVCLNGYPQPSWQVGFTQDTVRDLPDVSLFASDEGNYSFTAVCLQGECTPADGGPESTTSPLVVAEIGGTSVSAPSFAGIMALVEQKAGSRLGQANAVLYALAKQAPSAFHDISVGTNSVQCTAGSPNCSNGYITGYNAATGYDLATGLGSVDAAVLANNWSNVTQQGTTTTLTITPANTTHGTTQTFTVNVTGGATGGNVAIVANVSGKGFQGEYATNCTAFPCTFTYAGLPGGSYNVAARFSGDATHAASTSATVPVTIAPQSSEVDVTYEVGETYTNGQLQQVQNVNGQTLVYAGLYEFNAIPIAVGAALPVSPELVAEPATGTITILDNGVAVGAPAALNIQGNVEINLSTLPVGQHSIVVSYSGDASYAPSNSITPLATPMNFTIVRAPTSVTLIPYSLSVTAGTPVTLNAYLNSYNPSAATGTFTVQIASANGTVNLPAVPVTYSTLSYEASAAITIPPSALVAGTNTVSVAYSGDANQLPSPAATTAIQVVAANTSFTIAPFASVPAAGSRPDVYATLNWLSITGNPGIGGYVQTLLDGTSECYDTFSFYGFAGNNENFDCTFYTPLQPGPHTLTWFYSGDTNYTSATASVNFTVSGTTPLTFGLTATPVTFPAQATNPSGTSTLSLQLPIAFSNALTFSLACSTANAPAGIACTVPASLTIPSGTLTTTALATVTLAGSTASMAPVPIFRRPLTWLAILPAFWLLRRQRRKFAAFLCVLLLATAGLTSCGSSSHTGGSGGGGGNSPQSPLTPGTYAVNVTAQSGTTTQTAAILIQVQ